jgi:hypothetical protein
MDGSAIASGDGSIVAGDRVYDPKPTVRIAFVERLPLLLEVGRGGRVSLPVREA